MHVCLPSCLSVCSYVGMHVSFSLYVFAQNVYPLFRLIVLSIHRYVPSLCYICGNKHIKTKTFYSISPYQ